MYNIPSPFTWANNFKTRGNYMYTVSRGLQILIGHVCLVYTILKQLTFLVVQNKHKCLIICVNWDRCDNSIMGLGTSLCTQSSTDHVIRLTAWVNLCQIKDMIIDESNYQISWVFTMLVFQSWWIVLTSYISGFKW